jgi:hypothetical protein
MDRSTPRKGPTMPELLTNLQAWFDCQMMMFGGQMGQMCQQMMMSK